MPSVTTAVVVRAHALCNDNEPSGELGRWPSGVRAELLEIICAKLIEDVRVAIHHGVVTAPQGARRVKHQATVLLNEPLPGLPADRFVRGRADTADFGRCLICHRGFGPAIARPRSADPRPSPSDEGTARSVVAQTWRRGRRSSPVAGRTWALARLMSARRVYEPPDGLGLSQVVIEAYRVFCPQHVRADTGVAQPCQRVRHYLQPSVHSCR